MTDTSSSKVEAAKDQAAGLKDEALASGQHVAKTAADQAGSVVGEAKVQAKDLLGQAQSELRDQAGAQQQRVASGLRSVSDELSSMADSSTSGGLASDLVQQAASRAGSVASWLEGRDAGTLLSDVRAYAARKPGTFIAVAAIAGVAVGRLTRSLAGNAKEAHDAAATAPTSGTTGSGIAGSGTTVPTAVPATTAYADPAYVDPLSVDSTFAAPTTTATASAGTESLFADAATSTGIDPTYADPAFAAPTSDTTFSAHSVDDEYGDSQTVESLFEEPARPSFDETAEGDDLRGGRS